MTDLPPIPLVLRTRLAHATLQAVAEDCEADILHIKGGSVDASLLSAREDVPTGASVEERALTRISMDADVLIRPAHLRQFLAALKHYGWQAQTRLYGGGAVEHSVDWWHPELGRADIHVRFPGIQLPADRAFEVLWNERRSREIAHRPCPVPSLDAQRLILLLHAARNGGAKSPDVAPTWTAATAVEQARVRALAATLRAEVALAGATGHLEEYADRPEYDLWRLLALPDADVFDLWVAMVKAAPTNLDRAKAVIFALRVKADRVELGLQRRATPIEVLGAHSDRIQRGAAGIRSLVCRATSRVLARLPTRPARTP